MPEDLPPSPSGKPIPKEAPGPIGALIVPSDSTARLPRLPDPSETPAWGIALTSAFTGAVGTPNRAWHPCLSACLGWARNAFWAAKIGWHRRGAGSRPSGNVREGGGMAYCREDLAPGDIVLVAGDGLFGLLIRASTASPFTHAALVTGPHSLVEAEGRVVRSPATKYARTGWVFRVAADADERARAVHAAEMHLGARYGVRELLLDALRFDLHLVPRVGNLRHFTCSGLVAVCYAEAGVRLTYAPWPAPVDLGNSPLLQGRRPWEGPNAKPTPADLPTGGHRGTAGGLGPVRARARSRRQG